MFSGITITIISSVFYLFLCCLVVRLFYFLLRHEPSLSSWVRRRKGSFVWITSSLWGFPSPNFNLHVHLVLYLHTSFPSASISFIDNPVIITEPAVTCARLLSLGSKPYPSSEFQGGKTFWQASAHPLSQAQGGLFRVLTVFVFCWSSEWNARGANVCSLWSIFIWHVCFFFVAWKLLWIQNNQC